LRFGQGKGRGKFHPKGEKGGKKGGELGEISVQKKKSQVGKSRLLMCTATRGKKKEGEIISNFHPRGKERKGKGIMREENGRSRGSFPGRKREGFAKSLPLIADGERRKGGIERALFPRMRRKEKEKEVVLARKEA